MSTAVAPATQANADHERPREYADALALVRRFIGSRRVVVVGIILLVVEALAATIEPFPIAYLIDYFHHSHHALHSLGLPEITGISRVHMIFIVTAAIVIIAAINSASDSGAEVCLARAGRTLGYNLRVAMYAQLQRLSLSYHDRRRTGDVLTRVTGDVLVVEEFVVDSVSDLIGSFLVLILAFTVLALRSWKVALVALVIVPLLGAISSYFSRRIKAAAKRQRAREGELASTAQEMLSAIRLVQSYGRGKVDHDRFAEQSDQSMRAALSAAISEAAFSFTIALVEASAIVAIVWLGMWLLDRNAITVGTLVLFILLIQNMFKPSRKIVSEWNFVGKTLASVERIRDLLDRVPSVTDGPDAVAAPVFTGRLTFDRVSFAYPSEGEPAEGGSDASGERRVLHDISFEVEPGAVVAIVGPSGAGKSTIAQLVPRLYDPDEGTVRIDGADIRHYTLESLRRQVSLVLQDTVLFSGTVADNIGYGIADATRQQVVAAAKLANAHDFIEELPAGYDTLLGERGANLSGGQRQRIAIARAFIRESPLLILDEPTTGLDAHASHLVIGALGTLMHGKTTVLISHDLGLVRRAEVVLVLEGGRVVESGSHEDLLRAGGVYADLCTRRSGLDGSLGGSTVPLPADANVPSGTVPAERRPPPGAGNGSVTHRGPASTAAPPVPQTGVRVPPALAERLPGLTTALDESWARAAVGRVLLGRDDPAAVTCRLGPVWLREDGSCQVRYTAVIEDDTGGRTVTVSARVLPNAAHGRPPAASFGRAPRTGTADWAVRTGLAAWDRSTGVVLRVFPYDPDLPTLPAALDPTAIWPVLGRAMPEVAGEQSATWCEVSVAHYPREGPCVLCYHLEPDSADAVPRPLAYGKVYSDAHGALVSQLLTLLGGGLPLYPGPGRVRLPCPLGYLSGLRLVLTEAIPGTAALPRLLADLRPADGAPSPRSNEPPAHVADMISAAGAAAAALHAVHPRPGQPPPVPDSLSVHTLAHELASLRAELAVVRPIWPDVAAQVDTAVTELSKQAMHSAGRPPVLSHGDFTPGQLLIDLEGSGELGLVNFDAACQAEPAFDLGRFLAYLHVAAVRRAGPGARPALDNLAAALLNSYDRAARATAGLGFGIDWETQRRVAAFRAAHLARLALRACRRLKDDRARIALDLLTAHDTGKEWT